MKKSVLLLGVVTIFSTLAFIGCSKELDQTNNTERILSKSIVSPDGFFVAKDYEELKNNIFNDNEVKNVEIISIEYLDIKNKNGAAAIINYTLNGETKNLALVVGKLKTSYKSKSIKIEKIKSNTYSERRIPVAVYTCSGLGCCYVGGEMNLETNTATFYCKCEGNPGQNSSCSLTVTN